LYRIILVLLAVVIVGFAVIYTLQQGPSLFVKPPDSERIAFVSNIGGHIDIWVMKADGTGRLQITNDPANDRFPVWSPNAKEIAFISNRAGENDQLYVAGWNGRYVNCLTTTGGVKDMPVWTDDGKEIMFIASGTVWGVKRMGGKAEQYLPPKNMPEIVRMSLGLNSPFKYAAWSVGKKVLVFAQQTDLGEVVGVIDSEQFRELQETSVEGNWEEIWSPTGIILAQSVDVALSPLGDKVAVGFIGRKGNNGLLVADTEYGETTDLFISKDKAASKPSWSPDGKMIAFEMWTIEEGLQDKCIGIYTISAQGGKPKLVIKGDARDPSWSPDGKYIVCTLARGDGNRDVWRVNASGSSPVNLTKGRGDNSSPVWSPSLKP
jgi:TolB protein